ncbi:8728_t:CDS:2, partial [Scutellospora calospora]
LQSLQPMLSDEILSASSSYMFGDEILPAFSSYTLDDEILLTSSLYTLGDEILLASGSHILNDEILLTSSSHMLSDKTLSDPGSQVFSISPIQQEYILCEPSILLDHHIRNYTKQNSFVSIIVRSEFDDTIHRKYRYAFNATCSKTTEEIKITFCYLEHNYKIHPDTIVFASYYRQFPDE